MNRDLDSGFAIFGIFIGLIIGAVATLLYSPVDGRSLRKAAEQEIDQVRLNADRVNASLNEGREAVRARQQPPTR